MARPVGSTGRYRKPPHKARALASLSLPILREKRGDQVAGENLKQRLDGVKYLTHRLVQ